MIDQGEMFDIANPCRGVCEVNNKGYCKGCLRKREERFHWNEFTPFQKQLIVNLCGRRRSKAIAARQQAEWLAKHGPLEADADIPQLDMFIIEDSQQDIASASSDAEASQQPGTDLPPRQPGEKQQAEPQLSQSEEKSQPEKTRQEQPEPPSSLFDMPENNLPAREKREKKAQKSPVTQPAEVVEQQPGPGQFDLF